MQSRSVIAGLDIGSHKICCAAGRHGPDGELLLLCITEVPSDGVKNGVIVNEERASRQISEVLKRAEEKCGVRPGSLYVNVTGEHIRGLNSRGAISISMMEGEITDEEVGRVIGLAKNVRIPEDQERLHVIPKHYSIDDMSGIHDPIGMTGERLEVDVHIVTASMSAAAATLASVRRAGGELVEMVFNPVAASEVLLTAEEKQKGVLLLDIGAGTMDVVLYYEDSIWHTGSVPLGGRNVTADIAYGLRLPMESAEELKICQGSAVLSKVDPNEKLTLPDLGEFYQRRVSRSVLAAMIEPRMEEMLAIIRKQLETCPVLESIGSGVVLTGGGACLRDVESLVEQMFGMKARLVSPSTYEDDMLFSSPYSVAVALGLLEYGSAKRRAVVERPGMFKRMSKNLEKAINAILNI
jgi:cell division protein FtsA